MFNSNSHMGVNKGWVMTLLQLIQWLESEHLQKEEKGDT
jgi:hypothetical protein